MLAAILGFTDLLRPELRAGRSAGLGRRADRTGGVALLGPHAPAARLRAARAGPAARARPQYRDPPRAGAALAAAGRERRPRAPAGLRPRRGLRRRAADRADRAQPGAQRARRDAPGRPRHHRDQHRPARPRPWRLAECRGACALRAVHDAVGGRYRPRDGCRHPAADLGAVLHHQAARAGDGARPRVGVRLRQAERRLRVGRIGAGPRHHRPGLLAGDGRNHGRADRAGAGRAARGRHRDAADR